MTEALSAPHVAHGVGWTALVYAGHIEVRVERKRDPITDAVRALIAPTQRRFWTVEAVECDRHNRDLYVLRRDHLA